MRWQSRACLFCLASLVLVLATSDAAAAKPKPITGTLSKPGYTLIALADSGKATSVVVRHRRFRLRPPAKLATLQLRAKDGVYAGPVVVGVAEHGKRAIVGVRAGAKLGKVIVKSGKGFAKLKKKLAVKFVNTKRTATAKKGVPIGAGKFGRVRVKKLKGPSSDPDLDGIPNVFDVDDNGNLVLDNLDPSSAARASQAGSEAINSLLSLGTGLDQTANVAALDSGGVPAGERDALIEKALPTFGWFVLPIASGDSVELDCGGSPDPSSPTGWSGGLSWCTKGGTGRLFEPGQPSDAPPFPDCCDANGDGHGTMIANAPIGKGMQLSPHATADQIGTGDTLIERVTTGGVEHSLLHTLQYSVATVPALVSYDDGQGDSATVSYPVSGPGSQPPGPPGPGTRDNPFPVKADPVTAHVTVRVTLWRPQRRPIPGEAGYSEPPSSWIDIGGLNYSVGIEETGAVCPQSAFLSHGSNLADLPSTNPFPGVRDLAADQPANPANTFAYTLDLTTCAASPVYSEGRPAPPLSFGPGDTRLLGFSYNSGSSAGSGTSGVQGGQGIYFKRVS